MIQKSLSARAFAELMLLGLIWGGVFFATRIALDEVSVLSAVAHRVAWASLVLWAVIWWRGIPLPRDPHIWGAFLVMGLLNNVVPFSLMAWGQLHIESGLTSILNAATAIFGVIAAAIFFADERIGMAKAAGVALGFSGVICAIGPEALEGFDIRSRAQLVIIAGAMSYAIAGIWARKRLSTQQPVLAAAGMLSGATLVLVPLTLLLEGDIDLPTTPKGTSAIAFYAIVATAGAYLLYYRVLALAGSGNLMLVTLVIPPVAIMLGAVFLGETLHPSAFVGFGLLAAGLVVLNLQGRKFR